MSREKRSGLSGGIQQLVYEIQEAASIPLSAIPEIAESESLRRAAERLQQSQRDFYQSVKDTYQLTSLSPEARESLLGRIAEARADVEQAEDVLLEARTSLREAALDATGAGMSNAYVSRLAGVPRQTVIEWRRLADSEQSDEEATESGSPDQAPEDGVDPEPQ